MSNTLHKVTGATKEKIGHVTGNESLEARGAAENAQAHAEQNAQKAHTHAKGVANNVEGAAQKATGHVTGDNSMKARGHFNSALGDTQRNV
ncbi:MAG: hypothetical protein J3Q66DRAFT_324276 [Benniella sp.]|nr:MAG: hypothetical protein J3Q66DRAFT_324276 [Benniella sp.]